MSFVSKPGAPRLLGTKTVILKLVERARAQTEQATEPQKPDPKKTKR